MAKKKEEANIPIAVFSGILSWGIWAGTVFLFFYVYEEVFGHKDRFEGSKFFVELAVLSFFGIGLALWGLTYSALIKVIHLREKK